jgi:deoxyribonuclease V
VAARWIGHFLLHHEHGAVCPCHRVVRARGELGGYVAGGDEAKMRRLRAEGVAVRQGTIDLEAYDFLDFTGDRPLERLARLQDEIAAQVTLHGAPSLPALVGGVDVSYPAENEGVAAYTLFDMQDGRLLWSTTVRRHMAFPYVSSYLTFRELPVYLELFAEVRAADKLAEMVLVDGTGILHPRRSGIASALGVVADVATVGVTKKLLCGRVDLKDMEPFERRPVFAAPADEEAAQACGVAIRTTAGSRRPLFISPGHRVNLVVAEAVVSRFLIGRRLPEPLYLADRLSRAAGRLR